MIKVIHSNRTIVELKPVVCSKCGQCDEYSNRTIVELKPDCRPTIAISLISF